MSAREQVRALIREEIARHRPIDDARYPLELIAETSVRFIEGDGPSRFEIIDPEGRQRTVLKDGGPVDFTIADLVADLKVKHPTLFQREPEGAQGGAEPSSDAAPASIEAGRSSEEIAPAAEVSPSWPPPAVEQSAAGELHSGPTSVVADASAHGPVAAPPASSIDDPQSAELVDTKVAGVSTSDAVAEHPTAEPSVVRGTGLPRAGAMEVRPLGTSPDGSSAAPVLSAVGSPPSAAASAPEQGRDWLFLDGVARLAPTAPAPASEPPRVRPPGALALLGARLRRGRDLLARSGRKAREAPPSRPAQPSPARVALPRPRARTGLLATAGVLVLALGGYLALAQGSRSPAPQPAPPKARVAEKTKPSAAAPQAPSPPTVREVPAPAPPAAEPPPAPTPARPIAETGAPAARPSEPVSPARSANPRAVLENTPNRDRPVEPPKPPQSPGETGPAAESPAPAPVAAGGGTKVASAEAKAINGEPEVLDTTTIRVDGKIVRLFGVEWARGGKPDDLTRYLGGREVTCEAASAAEQYRCKVEGRDLSEVVLYNGGGRASANAPPELLAAENHARTEKLGVWRR